MATAAEALRAAREQASISQAALARRSGVAQSTISRIERDELDPSWSTMQALLGATGWAAEPVPTSGADLIPAPEVARAMASSLRRGDEESAIRDLTEGVGRLLRVGERGSRIPDWAVAPPGKPFGDPVWDTYFATAYAYALEKLGDLPAAWMTAPPPLPQETAPGDDPSPAFRDWLRARTPEAFRRKNLLSRAEDWAVA